MPETTPPLYLDPNQPLEARIADLLGRLTLEEKVNQMVNNAAPIPRLNIPAYDWWNECLHGAARAGRATVFPQAIGMAAAWDTDLLQRVATAISDEVRAKHHAALRLDSHGRYLGLTCWSPNINIFRDPRWGRGQETYGEDPYLTARLGVAIVRGLQGDHPKYLKVAACAKHFAVHSGPEALRHGFDAQVDERDLRETYLPAFEALVTEAHVEAIMPAYTRVNGHPCAGNPRLLQEFLRGQWGFEGHVVSDCGAITDIFKGHKSVATAEEAAALAVNTGCDLECGAEYLYLCRAAERKLISAETINRALTRLLRTRFRLGMFDPPERVPYAQIKPEVVNCPEHRALARRMAQESIVLLKNEGNLLPLKTDLRGILVVGPHANSSDVLLGNYNGLSCPLVTIMQGLVGQASAGTVVQFRPACDQAGNNRAGFDYLRNYAKSMDVIVAVLGLSPRMEGEEGDAADSDAGGDRKHIGLPGVQQEFLEFLHGLGKPVVLVVTGGSPLAHAINDYRATNQFKTIQSVHLDGTSRRAGTT